MIKQDIVKYFARVKQTTPSYYYFKKRNPGVMDYIFNKHSGKYGPFGDLRLYFSDLKNFKNEQLNCIKEINKNLLLVLVKDQLAKMIKKRKRPRDYINSKNIKSLDEDGVERHILDFQTAFKSLSQSKKYDIDDFLDKNSYFNKSPQEVEMLYKAFLEPDLFKDILRSFGLTEEIFNNPDEHHKINIKEKEGNF